MIKLQLWAVNITYVQVQLQAVNMKYIQVQFHFLVPDYNKIYIFCFCLLLFIAFQISSTWMQWCISKIVQNHCNHQLGLHQLPLLLLVSLTMYCLKLPFVSPPLHAHFWQNLSWQGKNRKRVCCVQTSGDNFVLTWQQHSFRIYPHRERLSEEHLWCQMATKHP